MMSRLHKQRLITLSVMSALVITAVVIALYALRENINLYYTPTDCKMGKAVQGHLVRVGGMVVKNSVHYDEKTLAVSFDLTDFKETMTVRFRGILPDLFREGQGIVAMGQWMPAGYFKATEVLAKHDENYMPPQVKQSLKTSQG